MKSPESETLDRCPFCGRYCSAEDGYAGPYPPDLSLDDGAECRVYCTQGHYETLLVHHNPNPNPKPKP